MSSKWLERQLQREEEARQAALAAAPEPTVFNISTMYRWVTGDTIWEVARRLGFRPLELLEHNDIDDPRTIRPGDILHLPIQRTVEIEEPIRIELLPEPKPMHAVAAGIRKWSFGYAHAAEDIRETGPSYIENANITAVAVAHVPIGNDALAFYMDNVSLGDYQQTGRVRYTTGFKPEHLADGSVEQPRPV